MSPRYDYMVVEELCERTVKNFLDVLILIELQNAPKSGYDIVSEIHTRFDILISSGTVYTKLYSLEREGFVKGFFARRKKVFELTDKGDQKLRDVLKANDEIQAVLRKILSNNTYQT